MSYTNLVDVALTVDTSELQGTLERIDNNVEILVGKVKELEEVSWDEATIEDQISSYISANSIMDSDDVDRAISDKMDEYVSSDDLEQAIDDRLEGYMTEEAVKELAHDEGVLTADSLESSSPFSDLVQRVESLENTDSAIDGLGETIESLTQQVKAQDSAIDSQLARLEDLEKRADDEKSIESLAERMAQQDARIDTLLAHIEQLTLKMGETLERSDTALTFFGLIKQAFALLQRG